MSEPSDCEQYNVCPLCGHAQYHTMTVSRSKDGHWFRCDAPGDWPLDGEDKTIDMRGIL